MGEILHDKLFLALVFFGGKAAGLPGMKQACLVVGRLSKLVV